MNDKTQHNTIRRACESDEHEIGNNGTPPSLRKDRLPKNFPTRDFLERIWPGIVELRTSFECAQSLECDVWDFAVEITRLRNAGLAENEFRWLIFKKYVNHAREVTREKDDGRQFRQTGNLSFARSTCFVLTEVGALFASHLLSQVPAQTSMFAMTANGDRNSVTDPIVPTWDAHRRELRMNGYVIKRFKWSAKNQERILNSFEEEGWPHRVDDPIPPQQDQDQNQRLRDAITSLNRHQQTKLIRFRGDGSGKGVIWESVEDVEEP